MKTFLYRSFIGLFFGAFLYVLTINSMIIFGEAISLDSELFLKNSFGFLFCGWLFSVTPFYFDLTHLTLLQQTALHFATVSIFYFPVAFFTGWVPLEPTGVFLFIAIFIVIYSVIWLGFYVYFKISAQRLNEELYELEKK